jgi:hypothetical protein
MALCHFHSGADILKIPTGTGCQSVVAVNRTFRSALIYQIVGAIGHFTRT